jgi:hypothetical protein
MLNDLYKTPQLKNVDCNNNCYTKFTTNTTTSANMNTTNTTSNCNTDIDLFKNPKREFLDSRWLDSNGTYNDNCKNCKSMPYRKHDKNDEYKKRHKNVICSVVKLDKELEECTNQDNNVTNEQLEKASSNNILQMQFVLKDKTD